MKEISGSFKTWIKDVLASFKTLFFWAVAGVVTGALVGAVGVAFHYGLHNLSEVRSENRWIVFFLPLGGLLIVWLYNLAGMKNDKGTNAVILAVRSDGKLPFRTAVLIFISTIITHFLGGSSGREGAALQIGGSIAATEAKIFKVDEKDKKIFVMCGMSACFSALFGTPVTAAIFSIEMISVGIMHYSAIIPCVMSSIMAYRISVSAGVEPTSFRMFSAPEIDTDGVNIIIQMIPFAVACAFVCRLFCFAIKKTKKLFVNKIENEYIRVLLGSFIIIALTVISGSQTFNGAGGNVINESFVYRIPFYYFAFKIIFTAVTLGCGFKGGEIVPSFFVGATFGNFFAPFFGIDLSFGAGIGLISVFCGATNCPIASIFMSIELFGTDAVPFFALACGISYLMSGNTGLYGEQKIMYSRLRPEYLNLRIGDKKKNE